VLEAGFIVTLLGPHHKNFGKGLIKGPQLTCPRSGALPARSLIRLQKDAKQLLGPRYAREGGGRVPYEWGRETSWKGSCFFRVHF